MLHLSTDPIAKLVAESEQRLKDARHKPLATNPDDGEVPVQRPEAFDLLGAAETCGLVDDPGFNEILGTMKSWEEAHATAKKPRNGDGEWKEVFFSALQTLLRETLYTKDKAQRKTHMQRVYDWYSEKMQHFDRIELAGRKEPEGSTHALKGFGSTRTTRREWSEGSVDKMEDEGSSEMVNELSITTKNLSFNEDGTLLEETVKEVVGSPTSAEDRAAHVRRQMAQYQSRNLHSSYKKRLATHGLLLKPEAEPWHRPGADVERISSAATEIYGDPSNWEKNPDEQKDFHQRYPWADPSFDKLSASEQRVKLGTNTQASATRQAAWPDPESQKLAAIKDAVVSEGMGAVAAERAIRMGTAGPGAELRDSNVPVSRQRPQTAPVQRDEDPNAGQWRAKNNFTFYTPSDDPKELRMHAMFREGQQKRLEKHQRDLEMSTAIQDWTMNRSRIEEEVNRREAASKWEPRHGPWGGQPRAATRILDVHADDDDDDDEEDDDVEIFEDDGEEDFAPGVEGKPDENSDPKNKPVSAVKKKPRPKSRGAMWLSSYHKQSFHRLEYKKPTPAPKPSSAHRPMYVQRPESAVRLVAAGSPREEFGVKPANQPPRPMSSLPTKARPMSATEYRKKRVAEHGPKAQQLTDDGKPPDIPIPSPDPEWTREQTQFRVEQSKELQGVREAFARRGQRMPMATIERALTLPKERTFEECMSAMQTATYMLKKDPNAASKKKKKGKKKKKK